MLPIGGPGPAITPLRSGAEPCLRLLGRPVRIAPGAGRPLAPHLALDCASPALCSALSRAAQGRPRPHRPCTMQRSPCWSGTAQSAAIRRMCTRPSTRDGDLCSITTRTSCALATRLSLAAITQRLLGDRVGNGALLPQGKSSACDQGESMSASLNAMRRRGKAQTLRPFWHGRVVDRLHVDAPFIHQIIRQHFRLYRIFDHHRHDMAWFSKCGMPARSRPARSFATWLPLLRPLAVDCFRCMIDCARGRSTAGGTPW